MRSNFIDLAITPGEPGREDNQWPWYADFRKWMDGKSILDVGTGISTIKQRLSEWGWTAKVTTQEPCLACPADSHDDLSSFSDRSFQTVTCFDVIEHVRDYGRLMHNMARIASECVVVTTPGMDITKGVHVYHWHEFYPDELCQLFEATGMQFVWARGSTWNHWPDSHKETRSYSLAELRDNPPIHPVGIIYAHKGIHAA